MNYLLFMEVNNMTMQENNLKRHKNADLIHAWAEGAVIQFKASNGTWENCLHNEPLWQSDVCYRIKPAKRVILYRNYLTKSGDVAAWSLIEGSSGYTEFKRWIGDWQSVEVGE